MSGAVGIPSDVRYVDTHCHVDLYSQPYAIMNQAVSLGIGVVAVTNTPSVYPEMVKLIDGRATVWAALGLHPELALEREAELSLLPALAGETRFFGEIGLDGHGTAGSTYSAQVRVFRRFLEVATEQGNKLITVHSRRAAQVTLDILSEFPNSGAILHWFSGPRKEAIRALELGCYFSVNDAMLRSSSGLSLLGVIPRERILTETDGPFVQTKGRSAVPADIIGMIDGLASLWCVDHESARMLVLSNWVTCLETGAPLRDSS